MGYNRWQAELTNDASGSGNPAYVHFDVDQVGGPIDSYMAALILQYLGTGYPAAINTRILGITKQTGGVGTLVPVPFPTAAYAARVSLLPFLSPMAGYAATFGAGALAPAGSSETVSLYSTLANRHGYGRHYLPFLAAASVNSSGGLSSTYVAGTAEAYSATFLGVAGSTWTDATDVPVVVVSATAGQHLITAPKVSAVIAMLHTRRK